jgi:hypothetical protein
VITPLRFGNTYYNTNCVDQWAEVGDTDETVIAYMNSSLNIEDSSYGSPTVRVALRFPRLIVEHVMNEKPFYYRVLAIGQSAVVFYDMDEAAGNFIDFIGGLHATVGGTMARQVSATSLDINQLPTTGVTYDGSSAYALPPEDNIFGGAVHTAKSVVLWIKPTSPINATQMLWEEGSVTDGLSVYLENGKAHASVWVGEGAANKTVFTVSSSNVLQPNVWQMVCAVFNFATNRLYLYTEPLLGEISADIGVMPFSSMPVHAGGIGLGVANGSTRTKQQAWDFGVGRGLFYSGGLDNVTYYNKALSGAEIKVLGWAGHAGVGAL